MPLTVPPFTQFQGQLVPLRGLWNVRPPEGDKFVNCEIDWGSQTTPALQIALSGNSPVALSQIAALYVDNRRCGVDCDFQFPDSGFLLSVPAKVQVLAPVLTNALQFYVIAQGVVQPNGADVTIVQILNSIPPPLALVPSQQQNANAVTGVAIANASTQLIPVAISGSINTISLAISANGGASGGAFAVSLIDGSGQNVWTNAYNVAASTVVDLPVELSGLSIRFQKGLSLAVSSVSGTVTGSIAANVYYATP